MPAPQSLPSRLIGALFVERGLVSESQIRVALEIQQETGEQLGQLLVQRFGVSRKELASVVAEQWAKLGGSAGPEDNASWRRLGDIFVERGFVTQEELDEALTRQRQTGERLGEALVAQGVISKFELAGALAEQMAVLGEPVADDSAPAAQPEATVHMLHTRDDDPEDAPAASNVVELVPAKADAQVARPDDVQETGSPDVAEIDPPAAEVDGAAVDAVALVEPVPAVEPAAFGELAETVEELDVPETIDPVSVVEQPESDVDAPHPAEVMLSDLHDALATEISPGEEHAPESEPVTACLAYAPTTDGYRLVALDAIPEPGETIEVAEAGEFLVLRVGRPPLPGDDRPCAFLEERVTAPLALGVH